MSDTELDSVMEKNGVEVIDKDKPVDNKADEQGDGKAEDTVDNNADETTEDASVIKPKILCVDDVQFMLLSMKQRLKRYYDTFPAQNVEEMYKILNKTKPNLIILDINMPDTDGFKIIEELKSNPDHSDIPVIFLTGDRRDDSVIKCLELGAADVLFKPISDEDLYACIDRELNPAEESEEDLPTILAVDDTPSILKTIHHTLTGNFKVLTLQNPEALPQVLNRLVPDLFILDVQMPGLSGFDLVPIIRSHRYHSKTPIVFLTSETSKDNILSAIKSGANDYMAKPINETLLFEKMEQHLKNYKRLRRIRTK